MSSTRRRLGGAVFAAILAAVPLGARAANFSFAGTFTQDDNARQITFTLAAPGTVTVRSYGFAGGTNAAGSIVPAGGFDTVVQVFDASGLLVALADDGACAQTGTDPATGFCLDAYWSQPLPAGSYTLVLTEGDNRAIGPTFAEGFLRDTQVDFTGPAFLGAPGSFVLVNGARRTAAWALDVLGVDTATLGTVPVELMRFSVE